MSLREIEYNKVDGFSKLLIDYVSNSDHFNDLISDFPSIDNLNKQISRKSKNYDKTFRETLVKEISTQYNDIDLKIFKIIKVFSQFLLQFHLFQSQH